MRQERMKSGACTDPLITSIMRAGTSSSARQRITAVSQRLLSLPGIESASGNSR